MKESVYRLKNIIKNKSSELKNDKGITVYVIANSNTYTRVYAEYLHKEINSKNLECIRYINSSIDIGELAGEDSNKIIIALCGLWYKNNLVDAGFINLINAFTTVPIDEIECSKDIKTYNWGTKSKCVGGIGEMQGAEKVSVPKMYRDAEKEYNKFKSLSLTFTVDAKEARGYTLGYQDALKDIKPYLPKDANINLDVTHVAEKAKDLIRVEVKR